ncbi:unnamed protein product [Sphacelaria rigidula]
MVQALVLYDVHIGQRNWNAYTPFGEARMNNHTQVAKFLSECFTPSHLGSTSKAQQNPALLQHGDSHAAPLEAWDREIEEKRKGWDKAWDDGKQEVYYYNVDTGETSATAPCRASAARVEQLRSGAKVTYRRKVAAVKGDSLVGLADYRDAFEEEQEELDHQKLTHKAATAIQSGWRMHFAQTIASHMRLEHRYNTHVPGEIGKCDSAWSSTILRKVSPQPYPEGADGVWQVAAVCPGIFN